jgi:hypothetical protein
MIQAVSARAFAQLADAPSRTAFAGEAVADDPERVAAEQRLPTPQTDRDYSRSVLHESSVAP